MAFKPDPAAGGFPPEILETAGGSVAHGDWTFCRVVEAEALARLFRFRFEVFGEELAYLDKDSHPGEMDTDLFDRSCDHFACYGEGGQILSYCRVILDSEIGLPTRIFFALQDAQSQSFAELSRLSLLKRVRGGPQSRLIKLNMYKVMNDRAQSLGIDQYYFTTNKAFLSQLRRSGMPFENIEAPGRGQIPHSPYYEQYFVPGDTTPVTLRVDKFADFVDRSLETPAAARTPPKSSP